MMNFFRRHMRLIFGITIVGFLAGSFIGFGGYFFNRAAFSDKVATVNGKGISFRDYSLTMTRNLEALRQKKVDINKDITDRLKQEVLQELIQDEIFVQEAKNYGITVTDQELASYIQSYPVFQRDGRFDRMAYFNFITQQMRITPKEFEALQRRQIAISKLRFLIASGVKITDQELRQEYAKANKGNMANFEKDRERFSETVRQEKTMMVFNEWFKNLNQTLKVKVYPEVIQQRSGGA